MKKNDDILGEVIEKIQNYNMGSQENNKNDDQNASVILDPLKYLFSLKDSIGSKMVELSTLNE